MNKCIDCGAPYLGYGPRCETCRSNEIIKKEHEKNRRQNESLAENARQQTELLRRQAELESYRNRELMERHAAQQQALAEHHNALAEQQLSIENQKLFEIQKQTKLIEEQRVTVQEAFEEGLALTELHSYFFLNENKFTFENPFITPQLMKAYATGAEEKISKLISNENSWKGQLFSAIQKIAHKERDSFLSILESDEIENEWKNHLEQNYYQEKIFPEYVDLPMLQLNQHSIVELIYEDITITFGYLFNDFRLRLKTISGEVFFLNQNNFREVTTNDEINQIFNKVFDFDGILNIVNKEEKKLYRQKNHVESMISHHSSLIQMNKQWDAELRERNFFRIPGVITILLGIYLLFNAGYGVGNIIPFASTWLVAAMLKGFNWEFEREPKFDSSKVEGTHKKLEKWLGEIENKLLVINSSENRNAENQIKINQLPFEAEQLKDKSIFKKLSLEIYLVSFLFLVAVSSAYLIKPSFLKNLYGVEFPDEVNKFAQQKENCDYFLRTNPSVKSEIDSRNNNIKLYCTGSDLTLQKLKKKYRDDKSISLKLSSYSVSSILETGPPISSSYVSLRKKLIATKWKPWKFVPLNDNERPFPEVLYCDEGYCSSYFFNPGDNKVLYVLYKICGSEYITGECAEFKNGDLVIERFETISTDEANKRYLDTKKHFDY